MEQLRGASMKKLGIALAAVAVVGLAVWIVYTLINRNKED